MDHDLDLWHHASAVVSASRNRDACEAASHQNILSCRIDVNIFYLDLYKCIFQFGVRKDRNAFLRAGHGHFKNQNTKPGKCRPSLWY